MEIAKILLSSAVIVAIINVFLQNKSNKLNYITAERAEWRKNLKNIVVDIENSDKYTIHEALTKLKVNLNYYGKINAEVIAEEKIDIFKDQHIWKTIYLIEKCSKDKFNEQNFEKYKKKLIDYIGFLLKFDWERSKYETKSDFSFLIFAGFMLANTISIYYEYLTKQPNMKLMDILTNCIIFTLPNIFLFIPIIVQKIEVMHTRNWYREVWYMIISWMASVIFYLILFVVGHYEKNFELTVWSISYIVSFYYSICFFSNERKVYIDYSNELNKYRKLDSVIVYYRKSSLGLISAFAYLNKKGIEFSEKKIKDDNFNISILEKAENKNDEKIKKLKISLEKCDKSLYKYTLKLKNRNKYIIKYTKEGKIFLSVGKNKKTWNSWFD